MLTRDPAVERRGRVASALFLLALLPGPLLALSAAVVLTTPPRVVADERGAVANLAKISAIVVAITAVLFISSILWFGLMEAVAPLAETRKIGRLLQIRHLTEAAAQFALELFVAASSCAVIESILSRRRRDASPIVELLSRNAFRLCLFLSFASTMQIARMAHRMIHDGFYDIFKIFMIIFLSSLYTVAGQITRVLSHLRDFWIFSAFTSETSADLLIATLSNAFSWTMPIAVWSAFVIVLDVARWIAGRVARSFAR